MASALRNVARSKLRVAMIPADGIGREVLPARILTQYEENIARRDLDSNSAGC